MRIELLEQVDSTNEYIKRHLAKEENVIVCAEEQTSGRGTKGRSFLSGRGGVYLSALTFYDDMPAANAFQIMAHAAVSVCRTAEKFGASPEIKWANDVLVNGRKLAGILIENGLSGGRVHHSIVGIGLNVRNDISALDGIAVSLSEVLPQAPTVEEARNALIENYLRPSTFFEYLSYVKFLGRPVRIVEGEREYDGIARRILEDGRLEIEERGRLRTLSSGEIRLKLSDLKLSE